jgi:hypothetical protein
MADSKRYHYQLISHFNDVATLERVNRACADGWRVSHVSTNLKDGSLVVMLEYEYQAGSEPPKVVE